MYTHACMRSTHRIVPRRGGCRTFLAYRNKNETQHCKHRARQKWDKCFFPFFLSVDGLPALRSWPQAFTTSDISTSVGSGRPELLAAAGTSTTVVTGGSTGAGGRGGAGSPRTASSTGAGAGGGGAAAAVRSRVGKGEGAVGVGAAGGATGLAAGF